MFTVRNFLALAVLLFGASFLWLTPMWTGLANPKLGVLDPKGLLAIITVIGLALAAWGIFKAEGWWEPIAIGSALIGIVSVVPHWITASGAVTVDRAAMLQNIGLHLAGAAVVVAFLMVTTTERWLARRL
jgi:hypothetical protein